MLSLLGRVSANEGPGFVSKPSSERVRKVLNESQNVLSTENLTLPEGRGKNTSLKSGMLHELENRIRPECELSLADVQEI
jgi:hypothetical protein